MHLKVTFKLIKEGNKVGIGIFLPEVQKSYLITELFSDIGQLQDAVEQISSQLRSIISQAKTKIEEERVTIAPTLSVEEIWDILNKIDDEKEFISTFNSLDEDKRREIAEFVFSKCNVFSGKGALFSFRYNRTTALLE